MLGCFAMRFLLSAIFASLFSVNASAELYIQKGSTSPDGFCAFAISYPPTQKHPDGLMQGCFVHPKTKKPIGAFFYLASTDAETYSPGSYIYKNYHNFDYLWSADSTHVAVTHNMRHFGEVFPFRRRGLAFQSLQMPDLIAPLKERLVSVLHESNHTSVSADRWLRNHRLVVIIARDAQVTDSGIPAGRDWNEKDWREYSLQFTLSFDLNGKSTIEATKFRIQDPQ